MDKLVARLDLSLRVYRSDNSSAWQEARHGRLWGVGPGRHRALQPHQ
ncbi:hypothetical protein [Thiorhodovibrio winogradskyi]|nr:hypothetical protein [Thiorhodovibrio litoralis]